MSTPMKPGEVYAYTPISGWCHEGTAIVAKCGRLVDTYWGIDANPGEYAIHPDEVNTARLLFDMADYDMLYRYGRDTSKFRWEQFHTEDRQKVTEQHGCRTIYFVRKGAHHSLAQRITNAHRDLAEAEGELRSAQRSVELRKEDLQELERELAALCAKVKESV